MNDLLKTLADGAQEKLREVERPDWLNPMLATLTDRRFSDDNWIFERKLDGERCLAFRKGDQMHLMSRNQKDLNVQYPELVEALKQQRVDDFIIDGEIAAFEGDVTSFARLQDRMHADDLEEARRSDVAVYYYVFDLLYLDGYDTTQVGLRHRKSLLKRALSFDDPLRFVIHRNEDGEAFFEEACPKRLGGDYRQASGQLLRPQPFQEVARVQVRESAGIRHRRLHGGPR